MFLLSNNNYTIREEKHGGKKFFGISEFENFRLFSGYPFFTFLLFLSAFCPNFDKNFQNVQKSIKLRLKWSKFFYFEKKKIIYFYEQ